MSEDLLKDLNAEQKEAVTHQEGPLLIIAGAGTGKTTVITKRLAWLIEQKLAQPDEILALTFTDKAAGEMEERVDRLLPYGYVDLWISTFHAFGERILKNHALEIGLPNDFKLLSQVDQWLLIRQNLAKFDLDYYRPLGSPAKFIYALVKHFSRAKDELVAPLDYLKYAEDLELNTDNKLTGEILSQAVKKYKEIANAYQVYQQILLDNNVLDFGDLINYALKLFKERPAILDFYRQKFKYILVDEFQDTNYAQYEMVKLLAGPKNNLTVCGDDDQAVYRWRGASLNNVLQFRKDFLKSKEIILINNYRSKQNILDLAYNFIQLNNPNRLEYQLNESKAILDDAKQKGIDLTKFKKINKKLIAQNAGTGQIEHLHLPTQEEEAKAVAKKIADLYKKDKEVNWSDFAILVRANSQADLYLQYLSQQGIPAQFLASRGLYSKSVVMDIFAYLRLLDNYHESTALFRILNLPVFNISVLAVNQLGYFAHRKNWSLFEAMKKASLITRLSEEDLSQINKLLAQIEKHSQLAREKNVMAVVYAFLEDSGYLHYLTKKENGGKNGISHLNQLAKKLQQFEKSNENKSVKNFMAQMDLSLEAGEEGSLQNDLEDGPDTVKILTVHGAKGLEFKYVFLVNLVALRFPTTERSEAIALPDQLIKEIIPQGDIHLQEERRLFYVAMTRAKDGLFLTSADDCGGQRSKKPSQFLYEAGLLNKEEGKTKKKKAGLGNQEEVINGEEKLSLEKPINRREKNPAHRVPDKFSFTQLKAFENCPLQYKFAHVLFVPVKSKFAFSFGNTMHLTLQKFFTLTLENNILSQASLFGRQEDDKDNKKDQIRKEIPPLKELLRIYEQTWLDDWYENVEHQKEYKEKGQRMLKEFYAKHQANWPKTKSLEMGFNFKLAKYTIKGKIDRVDEAGSGLELVDYKTGNVPKDEKDIDKDQLLIYQLAAEQLAEDQVLKQRPIKLTYYYLDSNQGFSFLGDEKDKDKIKDKIHGIIKEIELRAERDNFPATPGSFKCRFCDFNSICEYRQL
ncbi:MAG: UvrD-helicase domain-containing protein [bacterium]